VVAARHILQRFRLRKRPMPSHRHRPEPAQARQSRIRGWVPSAAFSNTFGEAELLRIEHELQERSIVAGGHVGWKGDTVQHWMVVIEGMVKVEAAATDGRKTKSALQEASSRARTSRKAGADSPTLALNSIKAARKLALACSLWPRACCTAAWAASALPSHSLCANPAWA
jgi:hypothetical protein